MHHTRTTLSVLAIGLLTAVAAPSATVAAPCRVGTICEPRPTDRDPPPPVPAPVTGSIFPSYYVLTVVYAPPGANGGKGASVVEYGAGSTLGTTTTTSASFKNGLKVSASASGLFGAASASTDFETVATDTDTTSLEVKKAITQTIRVQGGAADGIDHDKDLIYLWLNPRVDLRRDRDGVSWALGVAGPSMSVQYVYVGWLKRPTTMPAGVRARLDGAGIRPTDYPAILAADPLADTVDLDPARFERTTTTIPYIPPYAASDPVATMAINQRTDTIDTTSTKVEREYGVAIGVGTSTDVLGLFKAELKSTTSFRWTNSNTAARSGGRSETAAFTLGGPAFGYSGPTEIDVYWDTMYKSFAFAFAPPRPVMATGTVVTATGTPAANREVTFAIGGVTWRTFTDARGQFRFTGASTGAGTISVGGRAVQLDAGAAAQVRIKLPLGPLRPIRRP